MYTRSHLELSLIISLFAVMLVLLISAGCAAIVEKQQKTTALRQVSQQVNSLGQSEVTPALSASELTCLTDWKKAYVNFDVTQAEGFARIYNPGRVIVKFKQGTREADARKLLTEQGLIVSGYKDAVLPYIQAYAWVMVAPGNELIWVCKIKTLQAFEAGLIIDAVEPQQLPPPLPN